MKKNQYQEIILKATAYIKANLDNPISIPALAQDAGFSKRHVEKAFRKVLNEGVAQSILSARLDKSKELLHKTQLDITQIAFESGFENYSHFSKAFRRSTGMPPSKFREQVIRLKETPMSDADSGGMEKRQWFRDSFFGKKLSDHWTPFKGEWSQENGCMIGHGKESSVLFAKPLPENFRVTFQVYAETNPNNFISVFSVILVDERRWAPYCDFTLALAGEHSGGLIHFRTGHRWNPEARIKERQWHEISLELNEDLACLTVDGNPVFSFRDSFPPAYSSRCHMNLLGWHCGFQVREFVVQNLGFKPVVRPIRQGDALYNSGLANKAMEFYLRYLQAGSASDEETMELRYKIAMCCLRAGAYSQAQGWMDKVVSLRENKFWAEQTRLSMIELFWKMGDMENLLEHISLCLSDSAIHDQARVAVETAIRNFTARGFYNESLQILRKWHPLEIPSSFAHQIAQMELTECLQRMRAFDEAEAILLNLVNTSTITDLSIYSRLNLMQLYQERGKIEESERIRTQIEMETKDPYILIRCMVANALNLRAQERLEEASVILKDIGKFNDVEPELLSHTLIHCALILCCLGKLDEGRRVLQDACTLDQNRRLTSGHLLPFWLMESNYGSAAESVLKDYRNSKELVSTSAELGVKAGILHELAGKTEEAQSIFKEVSLRFPEEQVRYFGQLAKVLMEDGSTPTLRQAQHERSTAGNTETLKLIMEMPYEHFRRSEIFYLIGLLMEKRGDKEAARALFELSVKDDPAMRWPAFFSKQLLCLNVTNHAPKSTPCRDSPFEGGQRGL